MKIGSHFLLNNLLLAPMAGVTDKPFRLLCRRLGAGMAVSEMVIANPALYGTRKTRLRLDLAGEPAPRSVQIAGADPVLLAEAARYNVDRGADIIDINMGCPARKVCNVMAGSALLEDESLVARILESVIKAVPVPVTLKIRTGPEPRRRNAVRIARIAEQAGIQALTVHGRTRQCGFRGAAEHRTLARIKRHVSIPVIANGDIRGPRDAAMILAATGADGLMIGRAALGNPWIFREIACYLATGTPCPAPTDAEVCDTLMHQLRQMHDFYGEYSGVRIARKHIGWYLRRRPDTKSVLARINQADSVGVQTQAIREYFDRASQQRKAA